MGGKLDMPDNGVHPQTRRLALLCVLLVLTMAAGVWLMTGGESGAATGEVAELPEVANVDYPAWLEPRRLGAFELVGLVPEAHLRNSILVWNVGDGIVQYEAGRRVGNTLIITTTTRLSASNQIYCLGQQALFDELPTFAPRGTLRVYNPANGADLTSTVNNTFEYTAASIDQPINPSSNNPARPRYRLLTNRPVMRDQGAIVYPANMGCKFTLSGPTRKEYQVVYRFDSPRYIEVEHIASINKNDMRSFIGNPASIVGGGRVTGLNRQMWQRFDPQLPVFGRHSEILLDPSVYPNALAIRSQSDFILATFPPAFDPFGTGNGPGSSAHRIQRNRSEPPDPGSRSSVDHLNHALLPLHGNWKDIDQNANNRAFLEFFTTFRNNYVPFTEFDAIKGPEYILPPGIDYDPCMNPGTCSNALLDRIFNHTYSMTVHFYNVKRTAAGYANLTRVPLRMAGEAYTPARSDNGVEAINTNDESFESAVLPDMTTASSSSTPVASPVDQTMAMLTATPSRTPVARLLLPYIERERGTPTPTLTPTPSLTPTAVPTDDQRGCPCGWFDDIGRMWDYTPPVGDVVIQP